MTEILEVTEDGVLIVNSEQDVASMIEALLLIKWGSRNGFRVRRMANHIMIDVCDPDGKESDQTYSIKVSTA